MTWETLIAIIGAVGGSTGLIELVKYFANRKTNSRIAETKADVAEFHILQETNLFLQEQLKVKEERFAEQTQLVRQQNRYIITLERKVADLEIELVKVRCNDEYCPFREPPTAKTPPRPGMSKEEYHLSKRKQLCQPQPQSK
ncbi:MAG: hypothetical protein PUE39_03500 [bacterium]|nr:hypothetical protein [bacterium]